MPWHRERVRIDATWAEGRGSSMAVDVDGGWGALTIRLDGMLPPSRPSDGLWPATVTDPVHGWYRRRDGGVGRYSVWHPPLRGRLQPMAVRVARSQPFEDLGLVPLGQEAIAAAVVPTTTFDVHTPPRRC